MTQDEPGSASAHRRGYHRRRTLAVLACLCIAFTAINVVLLLDSGPWMAFQHKTSLDYAPAGPSTVWPSIEASGPFARQRLAAASKMLATGDLRGAQHEYLLILLSVAPNSAEGGEVWLC